MEFRYAAKREWASPAQRSVVMAPRGMVASSQHLATLSGYRALARGGNAVDAAVAMVATLSVVEPFSVGIGGDAFALIYLAEGKRLLGMNASGRAPGAATRKRFTEMGLTRVPERGLPAVTVPGALHGWAEAVARYGRLSLADALQDAIHYARSGFPVTEVISGEWGQAETLLSAQPEAARCYLIDGKAPRPGQVFRNPDLAAAYEKIADQGPEVFYRGEIAARIVEFCRRNGGFLRPADLESHATAWVEPLACDYRGYRIIELPPNGQGITALQMLNILQGYEIADCGPEDPEYLHRLIEAKKIAFTDRDSLIGDPDFEIIPVERLLSGEYTESCRRLIDPGRTRPVKGRAPQTGEGDTVYVSAVDRQRNAVSFISSIFLPFGSGTVVDGTGIILQNRGHSFSLSPDHPNRLEPGKRPLHTIIPAMLFKGGQFLMSFGVMGGDMQPQGHVQFLINLIDFKMNLQEALDAPRVRHLPEDLVYLEDGLPPSTARALAAKGHRLQGLAAAVNQVGGGQAIYLDSAQDVLLGASDRRKDGCAIGH